MWLTFLLDNAAFDSECSPGTRSLWELALWMPLTGLQRYGAEGTASALRNMGQVQLNSEIRTWDHQDSSVTADWPQSPLRPTSEVRWGLTHLPFWNSSWDAKPSPQKVVLSSGAICESDCHWAEPDKRRHQPGIQFPETATSFPTLLLSQRSQ